MAEFRSICKVRDLAAGVGKTFRIGDKLIAVYQDQGQYFAIEDTCPHMGASLSEGYVENGIVTCPWHAWRFRLADRARADNPRLRIGSYAVRVEGDDVQVEVDGGSPKKQ